MDAAEIKRLQKTIQAFKDDPNSEIWDANIRRETIEKIAQLNPALSRYINSDGSIDPRFEPFLLEEGLTILEKELQQAETNSAGSIPVNLEELVRDFERQEQAARENIRTKVTTQTQSTLRSRFQNQAGIDYQAANVLFATAAEKTAQEVDLTSWNTSLRDVLEENVATISEQQPQLRASIGDNVNAIAQDIGSAAARDNTRYTRVSSAVHDAVSEVLSYPDSIQEQDQREQPSTIKTYAQKLTKAVGRVVDIPIPDFDANQTTTIQGIAQDTANTVSQIPLETSAEDIMVQARSAAEQAARRNLPTQVRAEYIVPGHDDFTDKGQELVEALAAASSAALIAEKESAFKETLVRQVARETVRDMARASQYAGAVGSQPSTEENQRMATGQQSQPYEQDNPAMSRMATFAQADAPRIEAIKRLALTINDAVDELPPTATPQEIQQKFEQKLGTDQPRLVREIAPVLTGAATSAFLGTQERYQTGPVTTNQDGAFFNATPISGSSTAHQQFQAAGFSNVEEATPNTITINQSNQARETRRGVIGPIARFDTITTSQDLQADAIKTAQAVAERSDTLSKEDKEALRDYTQEYGKLTQKIRTEQDKAERTRLRNDARVMQAAFVRENQDLINTALLTRSTELVESMAAQANVGPWRDQDPDAAAAITNHNQIRNSLIEDLKQAQASSNTERVKDLKAQILSADKIFYSQNAGVVDSYYANGAPQALQQRAASGAAPGQADVYSQFVQDSQETKLGPDREARITRASAQAERDIRKGVKELLDAIDPNTSTTKDSNQQLSRDVRTAIANNVIAEVMPRIAGVNNDDLQTVINTALRSSLEERVASINPNIIRKNESTFVDGIASLSTTLSNSNNVRTAATTQMLIPFAQQANQLYTQEHDLRMQSLGLQGPTARFGEIIQPGQTLILRSDQVLRERYREDYVMDYKQALAQIAPGMSEGTRETLARELVGTVYGSISAFPEYEKNAQGFTQFHPDGRPKIKTRIVTINGQQQEVEELQLVESLGVLQDLQAQRTRYERWALQQLTPEERTAYLKTQDEKRTKYLFSSLGTGLLASVSEQSERLQTGLERTRNDITLLEAKPWQERSRDEIKKLRSLRKQEKAVQKSLLEFSQFQSSVKDDSIKVDASQLEKLQKKQLKLERDERKAIVRLQKLEGRQDLTEQQQLRLKELKATIPTLTAGKTKVTDRLANLKGKTTLSQVLRNATEQGMRFGEMQEIMMGEEGKKLQSRAPVWYKLSKKKNPIGGSIGLVQSFMNPKAGERGLVGYLMSAPASIVGHSLKTYKLSAENSLFAIMYSSATGSLVAKKSEFEERIFKLSRNTGINVDLMVKTGVIDPTWLRNMSYGDQLKLKFLINEQRNFDKYETILKKHPRISSYLKNKSEKATKSRYMIQSDIVQAVLHGRIEYLPGKWVNQTGNLLINNALLKLAPKWFEYDADKGGVMFKPWENLKKKVDNRVKNVRKAVQKAVWDRIKDTAVGSFIKGVGALAAKFALATVPVVGQIAGFVMLVDGLISKIPIVGAIYSFFKNTILEILKLFLTFMFFGTMYMLLSLLGLFGIGGGVAATTATVAAPASAGASTMSALKTVSFGSGASGGGAIFINSSITSFMQGAGSWLQGGITNLSGGIQAFGNMLSTGWQVGQSMFSFVTSAGLMGGATYAAVTAVTLATSISFFGLVNAFKDGPETVIGQANDLETSPTTNPLLVTKTADSTLKNPGDRIRYTINVKVPNCDSPIIVEDKIPENTTFAGVIGNDPAVPPVSGIVATGPDATNTLRWEITLSNPTPPCTTASGGNSSLTDISVTLNEIRDLLAQRGSSPLNNPQYGDSAQAIFDNAVRTGISPILMIGIFYTENGLGEGGIARPFVPNVGGCYNLGGINNCVSGLGEQTCNVPQDPGNPWCRYTNYVDSITANFDVVRRNVIDRGYDTVEKLANAYIPIEDPRFGGQFSNCPKVFPRVEADDPNSPFPGDTGSCIVPNGLNSHWKWDVAHVMQNRAFGRMTLEEYRAFRQGQTTQDATFVDVNLFYEVTVNANITNSKNETGRGCIRNTATATIGSPPNQLVNQGNEIVEVGGESCTFGTGEFCSVDPNTLTDEQIIQGLQTAQIYMTESTQWKPTHSFTKDQYNAVWKFACRITQSDTFMSMLRAGNNPVEIQKIYCFPNADAAETNGWTSCPQIAQHTAYNLRAGNPYSKIPGSNLSLITELMDYPGYRTARPPLDHYYGQAHYVPFNQYNPQLFAFLVGHEVGHGAQKAGGEAATNPAYRNYYQRSGTTPCAQAGGLFNPSNTVSDYAASYSSCRSTHAIENHAESIGFYTTNGEAHSAGYRGNTNNLLDTFPVEYNHLKTDFFGNIEYPLGDL